MGISVMILIVFLSQFSPTKSLEQFEDKAVEIGKFQFELIKRDSKMPRFGDCWTNSLNSLESGCKKLSDDVQSRLALQFANCFLEQAGQKSYPCQDGTAISKCLAGIDSNAFTAYSNFFTHTHNMCQFLQHQLWHQETEEAISGLTKTSSQVAESLKNSSKLQEDIVRNQIETLDYQKQIAEHGNVLTNAMEQSRTHVKELMNELRTSTDEQKTLIFSIFDRVTKLQSLLLSEVSWLYTVLFYSGCLLAIYLATATKRTEEARLWLFAILTVNFMIERLICSWTLDNNDSKDDLFDILINEENNPQALLHFRIWIARKLALFLSFLVLLYKALTFKDYNKINFSLLQDIHKQNADLCQAIKVMKSGGSSKDVIDQGLKRLITDDLGQNEDIEDADDEHSDDEDDLSFDSNITDTTWKVDFSDDEDDFRSLDTTPVNNNDVKEIVPIVNNITVDSFDEVTKPVKRRGRPPGSKNSSRGGTPARSDHSYNLRQRKQNQTFHGFEQQHNPILDVESPDSFGKMVANLARTARDNKKKLVNMSLSTVQENLPSIQEPYQDFKKLNVLSDNDE